MQSKTLYRSNVNYIIGGICGGLGEYFGVSPWLFRILFIIIQGSVLIYLVMWIILKKNPNQPVTNKKSPIVGIFIVLALLLVINFALFFVIYFIYTFFHILAR